MAQMQDKENKTQTAKAVNELHKLSDVDTRQESQHHTLGTGHNQSSAGDHTHDGKNSRRLLTGFTITGSKGGNTALTSVISALVQLGATDATTP